MSPRFPLLIVLLVVAATLAGCAAKRASDGSRSTTISPLAPATPAPPSPSPQPLPAEGPVAGAPGATAPLLSSAAPASGAPAAATAPAVPSGMLYVCAKVVDGAPHHTGIDYEPKVRELCSRHPEMGVCQYERDACRLAGGRVYDTRGIEITRQIEADYDRKVMRTRFRAG